MTPQRARLGIDVFTGLVIASVGLALANLTWRVAGYSGVGPVAAPVVAGSGARLDIRPLVALAPFGSAAAASAGGGDGPVRLRAIFLAIPAEASTVLITGADGKVASYGLGQAVGSGVIDSIQAEQIVVRTSGGLRTIGFNPDGGAAQGSAAPGSAAKGSSTSASAAILGFGPPGTAGERALIPSGMQGGRSASLVNAAPVNGAVGNAGLPGQGAPRSDAASGYVVGAQPGAAIIAAGIRPGDVIERVNGRTVGPGTNERDLFAQASAAGIARLEILRGGQRLSLTVPVR